MLSHGYSADVMRKCLTFDWLTLLLNMVQEPVDVSAQLSGSVHSHVSGYTHAVPQIHQTGRHLRARKPLGQQQLPRAIAQDRRVGSG